MAQEREIAGAVLQAGVAEADLKAYAGLDLSGFIVRQNPSTGVHDPVFVRALALRQDGKTIVLLTMDALGLERPTVEAIRGLIAKRLDRAGVDPASVSIMVACTHTHSAPAIMTLHGCGEVDPSWRQHCIELAAQTAGRAIAELRPARIGYASGTVAGVTINRRNTRGRSSEPLLDEQLCLWRVESADGRPLACVVNFTCHAVILGGDNRSISADYPGAVCAKLRERLGAITLFTNGADGDINPAGRDKWEDVERISGKIADEAQRLWQTTQTSSACQVAASSRELCLPQLPPLGRDALVQLRDRFAQDLENATKSQNAVGVRIAAVGVKWTDAMLSGKLPTAGHRAQLQLFRIGDSALVAVPGEALVSIGLEIKEKLRQLGFKMVAAVGYANGNVGYIPPRDQYAAGGYEIDDAHRYYGHASCVAPEAGESVIQAFQEMAQS